MAPRAVRPSKATTLSSGSKGTKVSMVSALEALALDPELMATMVPLVREYGRHIGYAAGGVIFHAGGAATGLHLVLSGTVRVVRSHGDRQTVVHEEHAGGVLGVVAFFGDGCYPATACAVHDTELIWLPAVAVREAMKHSTRLANWLLSWMAQRTREVIARLDHVAHKTVRQRVAAHLLQRLHEWQRTHGQRRAVDPVLSLGMTQQALAAELGTLKPLVVRALAALRDDGVIDFVGRGQYVVRDRARLEHST